MITGIGISRFQDGRAPGINIICKMYGEARTAKKIKQSTVILINVDLGAEEASR